MDKKSIALSLALLISGVQHAVAESMGDSSILDRRVQTAIYTPDNVFRIQSVIGRTTLIQFPQNETVNGESGLIIAGDPKAWSIGVNKAGNMIAIKPQTADDPNTNLIINTSKHTYLMELKLVKDVALMTYALRFKHPEPPKVVAVAKAPFDPCNGLHSGAYQVRGDKTLAPLEIWDNGTFTCFRFPNNVPRPVIYQVLPDGTETVANTRPPEGDIVVVHGISKLFRLRLNSLVMEARSTQQLNTTYNYSGTTTGEVREVKRAEQQ